MKKIISIILAAALFSGTLTAVGANDSEVPETGIAVTEQTDNVEECQLSENEAEEEKESSENADEDKSADNEDGGEEQNPKEGENEEIGTGDEEEKPNVDTDKEENPDAVNNEVSEQKNNENRENSIALFSNEDSSVVFDETFDSDMGDVRGSLSKNQVKYVSDENHTPGKTSGAIRLGMYGKGMANFQQSSTYGVERTLGGNVQAGKTYVVTAYIKGEPKRFRSNFKFCMGIYNYNDSTNGTSIKDMSANGTVQVAVTDEWQKMVYFWTPTTENYSNWRLRINPVNGQSFDEGAETDNKYNIFYIDDISIKEAPTELELTEVKPESGTVITASYEGVTADFNLPLGNDNEVSVTDSRGYDVAHTLKVDNTKLTVVIPNRVQDETYNVVFTRVTSKSGAEYNGTEIYSYVADERVMNETFDKNGGNFSGTLLEWTDEQNHSDDEASGAMRLRMKGLGMSGFQQSSVYGLASQIGTPLNSGDRYLVKAYIKGEKGRYRSGFSFGMEIASSTSKDNKPITTMAVSDEWQEIYFVFKPNSGVNYSNYWLRIHPVNEQSFNETEADHYVFYIDDISISKIDPMYVIDSESYPQNGSDGIKADGEYTLKFNKEIDTESFKDEYVKLFDVKNNVYVNCTTTVGGDTLTIKAEYPLLYEHDYKLILDGKIAADSKGIVALDTESEIAFTTQKNAITYKTVSAAGGKIKLSVSNNTDSDISAYAVAAVYENGLSLKNSAVSVALAANEQNKSVEIDTGLSSIPSYEIYFWDKADGNGIKSLANVQNKKTARTELADNADTWQAGYFVTDDKVEFKGQIETKRVGLPVIVRVIKENDSESGIEFSKLVRAEEVISGKDGYVSYSFKVPAESEALRYKVYIDESDGKGGASENVIDFVYASQSNINEALKKIDESSFEDMSKTFTDTEGGTRFSIRETLNLMNNTDFDKISAKNYVYKCFVEGKKDGSYESRGIDVFTELFNKAVKTAVLAEGDPVAAAEDLKANHAEDYWQISVNGESSAYKAFLNDFDKDTKAAVLKKMINESNGFGDNERIFNFAVVKENILMGDYNSAVSVMKKYGDIMTVNYSTYNSLTSNGRDSANSKFYNAVASISDLDGLGKKFEEIAAEVKKTDKTGSDSGKGSGSSGSSGSSSGTYLPGMVDTNKPAPDWYVDESGSDGEKSLFGDLQNAQWAVKYINRLYNLGAISGKADGVFAPSDNMTREELCKVIVLALGLKANDKQIPVFNDVDGSAWYAEYINICAQNGVINGIGDNLFGVGRTVTREETATILVRAAENAGITLDYDFTIFPFKDDAEISDWAKTSVSVLYESLILDGMENGDFAPKENVTRAQAAKMIVGVIDFKY